MKKFILLLSITAITTASCKKPEPGAPGKDGLDGNANVKTEIIATTNGSWSLMQGMQVAEFKLELITQSILDKGTVNVFYKTKNEWIALPHHLYSNGHLGFTYTERRITFLYWDNSSGPPNPGGLTFKVIVIAGN